MATEPIIGAVDLTVHLSSMNPLNHIDSRDANRAFERSLIQAAWYTARHSPQVEDMRANGLVVEGPGAKYFRMISPDDLVRFCIKTRELLVEGGLPFKMCARAGELTSSPLRAKWEQVIANAEDGDSDAKKQLRDEFNTDKRDEIEDIFSIYRAPGFKNDAVELAMDIESFKGLGVFFHESLLHSLSERDSFFKNMFPIRHARKDPEIRKFIDCKFDFTKDDVISRILVPTGRANDGRGGHRATPAGDEDNTRPEEKKLIVSEQRPGGGAGKVIEGGLDLMRRSHDANPDNTAYYVSFLVNLIRSSPFGSMRYLTEDTPDPSGEHTLAAGWQGDPVIFSTLLEPTNRQMFKETIGIEYVLASLLDEIFATLTGEKSACALSHQAPISADLVNQATESPIFHESVHRVRAAFGKLVMRKIYKLPDWVIRKEACRAILNATSK
ncbi:MAG: hypothetical protein AB7E24_14670 [Novosphingobium sp.]